MVAGSANHTPDTVGGGKAMTSKLSSSLLSVTLILLIFVDDTLRGLPDTSMIVTQTKIHSFYRYVTRLRNSYYNKEMKFILRIQKGFKGRNFERVTTLSIVILVERSSSCVTILQLNVLKLISTHTE